MTNPWIPEILTIIETEVLNKNGGLSERQILHHAIESTGKGMSVAEKTVLYPQFRSAVMPELLRNARARGIIGMVNGLWYPVAGNPALTTARSEDRQTNSEIEALSHWIAGKA